MPWHWQPPRTSLRQQSLSSWRRYKPSRRADSRGVIVALQASFPRKRPRVTARHLPGSVTLVVDGVVCVRGGPQWRCVRMASVTARTVHSSPARLLHVKSPPQQAHVALTVGHAVYVPLNELNWSTRHWDISVTLRPTPAPPRGEGREGGHTPAAGWQPLHPHPLPPPARS